MTDHPEKNASEEQEQDQELTLIKARVLNRVKRMTRVPIMSESTARLLEISRISSDEVNITELDRIITHDPTLATRILRVANSPYYAMRNTVNTVRQAILIVGLSDLFSLILVTSLMDKFEGHMGLKSLDPKDFWLHSVAVGAAACGAQPYCGASMLSPAEINLAGLLHDIGRSVFIRHFPQEFDQCVEQVNQNITFLQQAETEILGIGHDEAGAILAKGWNLPEFIRQVIQFHHRPDEAEEVYQDAVRLVCWCDALIIDEKIGCSGNIAPPPPPEGEESRVVNICQKHRSDILATVRKSLESLEIDLTGAKEEQKEKEEEEDYEAYGEQPEKKPIWQTVSQSNSRAPKLGASRGTSKPSLLKRVKGWFR